jgi:hypothetical protein
MPVLLELFAGTGSIGRAFEARGWRVISVDIDPHTNPDICMDVRDLTLSHLSHHPDLIWASPVCQHYSSARTRARTPRDFIFADSLVQAVLDLAETMDCPALMENPHSGLLKTRSIVHGIPYQVVDYCKYHDSRSSHTARKRTAIWCIGGPNWQPQRELCRKDCGHCTGDRHNETAQRGPSKHGGRHHTLAELYAMPPLLCEEIADWATLNVFGE